MFRQQAGAQLKPVVLEGTLQSPKLLAVVHGSNAPETTAAVSALGAAIQQLQQQLSSVFEDRWRNRFRLPLTAPGMHARRLWCISSGSGKGRGLPSAIHHELM